MSFFKKHKKGLIILAVIILIVAGVGYSCVSGIKKASEMSLAMLTQDTDVIERRDITQTLSTSGKVVANEKYEVVLDGTYFGGAEILEIPVEEGTYVKEGDVIAVMDVSAIEKNLEVAKKNQTASNLRVNSSVTDKTEAKKTLDSSLKNIDDNIDALYRTYESRMISLDQAKQSLQSAQINLYKLMDSTPNPSTITEYSNYTSAQNSVKNAEVSVVEAQKNVDDAWENYQYALSNRDNDIESANIRYKNSLNSANASLTSNSGDKLSSEFTIERYEQAIEDGVVKAPISGVITYVNYKQGEKYSAGGAQPLVVIEDISSYEIETTIDEYDIAKLAVGQKVSIKSNGTGDAVMDGEVSHINTRATSTAGLAKYTVKISIKNPDKDLRLDMTTKLTITISEKQGVLAVPYNAIQEDDDKKNFIEVVDENATEEQKAQAAKTTVDGTVYKKIYVTKGVENDYYTEVAGDGIVEGMTVKVINGDAADSLQLLMEQMGAMGGM